MQYAHGISPTTALPFSPPIAFRKSPRKPNHKNEKAEILEGLCHRCNEWAPVEGVKCVEAKVRSFFYQILVAKCIEKVFLAQGDLLVEARCRMSQGIQS